MSLGGLVYIISNHLSELEEDAEDNSSFGLQARFVKWANQLPLDQVKVQSLSLTQKMLHRIRLVLLKTDNHLMRLIRKISEKDREMNGGGNGNKAEAPGTTPDFWRDIAENMPKQEETAPESVSEVKIELASQKEEQIEKFFDPVRNLSGKAMDIKKPSEVSEKLIVESTKVSNGIDIRPAKKPAKNKKK